MANFSPILWLLLCAISGFVSSDDDCSPNPICTTLMQNDGCALGPIMMEKKCPGLCTKCGDKYAPTRGRAAVTQPKHEYDCADRDEECADFKDEFGCAEKFMDRVCAETCDFCSYEHLCLDRNKKCGELATGGECTKNATYMMDYCPESCGKCGTDGLCLDNSKSCAGVEGSGDCLKNATIMETCSLSCGKCGPDDLCLDKSKKCAYISEGDCKNSSLLELCPVACGMCGAGGWCMDKNKKCGAMGAAGDCTSKEEFMTANCPATCGKCPTGREIIPKKEKDCDGELDCEKWAAQGGCRDPTTISLRRMVCEIALEERNAISL